MRLPDPDTLDRADTPAVDDGPRSTGSTPARPRIVTDPARDALLTDFGRETLNDRYLLPGEGYQDLFARVAAAYADPEDANPGHAQRLYDYISRLWFMPATPVLSNGGTGRGLPISCYLNSVDDSLSGIVDTWNENVWLAARGGGIGTYWGHVRGIGEPVGLNGKTSGIIPFVRVMDSLTLAISQGSLRRGSAAVYLDINHPEIEEFLEIRKPSGDFNRKALNLHHGVLLTDAFMEAVRDGARWELRSPKSGEKRGEVDARALFQKLVETRLATGEPYIVFIDHVNNAMPKHQRDLGLKVTTSNLCSEITLPTGRDHEDKKRTAVCCLSSLNLEYWDEWRGDRRFIEDIMRFLDNVLSDYIERAEPSMAHARYAAERERSVGLGVMGFHSLLQAKGVPFEGADGEIAQHGNFPPHPGGSGRGVDAARARTRRLPRRGRDGRDGAVQLQARDRADGVHFDHHRRHIRLHRAHSGEHLHAQDVERIVRGQEPASGSGADRQGEELERGVELDPRARRIGAASGVSGYGREGGVPHRVRNRPALVARAGGGPDAVCRSIHLAEPVHPGGRGEVGLADAALPRMGTGDQVPLLSPLEVDSARKLRRRVEADNTPALRMIPVEAKDYDECLACQ